MGQRHWARRDSNSFLRLLDRDRDWRTVVVSRKQRQGQPSQRPVKKRSARIKTGMRPLRISAISYLNTAPLMWDFEHGEAGHEFEISYTLPSACARALEAGTADIGIIPAAAYAQVPGLDGVTRGRDCFAPPGAFHPASQPRAGRPDSHRRSGYVFDDVGRTDQNSVRKMAGRRQDVHLHGAEYRQHAGRSTMPDC